LATCDSEVGIANTVKKTAAITRYVSGLLAKGHILVEKFKWLETEDMSCFWWVDKSLHSARLRLLKLSDLKGSLGKVALISLNETLSSVIISLIASRLFAFEFSLFTHDSGQPVVHPHGN